MAYFNKILFPAAVAAELVAVHPTTNPNIAAVAGEPQPSPPPPTQPAGNQEPVAEPGLKSQLAFGHNRRSRRDLHPYPTYNM